MSKIISQNDLLKEQLTDLLIERMPLIEKRVLDNIFAIIDKLDTAGGEFIGGPLTLDTLLELATTIDQAMITGGYADSVNLFISDVPLNAFIWGANAVISPFSEVVNRFTRPCVSNRATLLPATALPLT